MQEDKKQQLLNIMGKLNINEVNLLVDILNNNVSYSKKDLDEVLRGFSLKSYRLESQEEHTLNNEWVTKIYLNEIKKINMIIKNDNLIKEIGGLKILLNGKTGTGKTTLVQNLIALNGEFNFEQVQWHNLVSPKMGQTQINIMQLENELSNKKTKTIVFLDELDSLITNRNDDKDIAEYSRIVGTFIKFLDLLNPNIIFIASTNVIDKIDEAIQRRFNVKIKGKMITFNQLFDIISSELNLKLSSQDKNILQNIFREHEFTLADAKQFITNYWIDINLSEIKSIWAYILVKLEGHLFPHFEKLSNTRLEEIEKTVKQYGNN